MRISISGVPGTGKSTLGRFLAKNTTLEYIPEIEDVVIAEMGFKSGRELQKVKGNSGMIDWFFISLDRAIKEHTQKDNYVADKCFLDYGARWFAHMWQGATPAQHQKVRDSMRKMVDEKYYDRIIYLPLKPSLLVEDDGLRTTDLELRYKRSLLLKGLFSEYDVKLESYLFKFSDSPDKVISELGLESFRRIK